MSKMTITLIIVAICAIGGIASIHFLGPDNPVEEACETVIKDETGADVDLSPGSDEEVPATGNSAAS